MIQYKIDTQCLNCYHKFPKGELKLCNDDLGNSNWGCPHCFSHDIEQLVSKDKAKLPFKYDEVKSSTPYDGQEEGN